MPKSEFETPYPFQAHLNYRQTGWAKDYARFEMELATFTENRHGATQGGVHATLLDVSMGFAGCYTGEAADIVNCLTLQLNVQYMAQSTGGLLIAEGFRTGGGRKTFFARGDIRDETGTLVAAGTGVFRYTTKR